jgi:SAM-dependent methyltransferase
MSHERDLRGYYDQEARLRDVRPIDPRRIEKRLQFIELLLAETAESVLEVGVGPGRDAMAFGGAGLSVVGIDLSFEHVSLARQHGVDGCQASVLKLPFGENAFDAIWTMSTLVHIPNSVWDAALTEICRVAKPRANIAIGLWRSDDDSDIEVRSSIDVIDPPRFFSRRPDASLIGRLKPYGELVSFETWTPNNDRWTYQFVTIRTHW